MSNIDKQGIEETEIIPYQAWYTLQEACNLKGINIKTSYNYRYYMPNRGVYEAEICGRKCFKRETVLAWLKLTDEDIPERVNKRKQK